MTQASGRKEQMPTRRAYHKKSKSGCKTCRQRRVKCDLRRPDCGNCLKVGRECTFRLFDPNPLSIVSRTPSPTNSSVPPYHIAPARSLSDPTFLDDYFHAGFLEGVSDALRPQFTHLLRHFTEETSTTISHNAMARSAWCAAVPQLAANHRLVVQGIFAITALHLSRLVGSNREQKRFRNIATVQMNTGLIQYREAIKTVTEENAGALFMFSVNITSFAILTTNEECRDLLESICDGRQTTSERRAAVGEMVQAAVRMMVCLRGALVILVPCWHSLVKGPLAPILQRDWWPRPTPTSPQAIEEDTKLQALEHMWQHPGRQYEYWYDTLAHALQRLRDTFGLVSQLMVNDLPMDWSSALDWPVRTSQGFVDLLAQKQPDAWIIMAHYAILLSRIPNLWWISCMAPNLVSTAALVIGPDMWKWIEWPASVVGVNLANLRP
ncbi:hypothetical protein CC80DRAFT_181835, partial [Byssothecium circinans]